MTYSKNILFDASILSDEKAETHKKHLKIATLNLDDYNKRLNSDIILVYNPKKFCFDYNDYNQTNHELKTFINSLCAWALQDEPNSDYWVKPFKDIVKDEKEELILNYCNFYDVNVQSKVHAFILRYKHYHPIVFLDNIKELDIKTEFNSYCSELSSLVREK